MLMRTQASTWIGLAGEEIGDGTSSQGGGWTVRSGSISLITRQAGGSIAVGTLAAVADLGDVAEGQSVVVRSEWT